MFCVTENPDDSDLCEAEKKARVYYESCMDPNKTIETLGSHPLLHMLDRLGDWNITRTISLDYWNTWDFQKAVEEVHAYGLSPFFNMWVSEDEKNLKANILQVRYWRHSNRQGYLCFRPPMGP